jgi:hypothetical protein
MSTATVTVAEARRLEIEALVAPSGTVTPKQIVDFARNADTALHGVFLWDDTEAGERYREWQASAYIRGIAKVIPVEGSDDAMRVRAFVSLSRDRGTGAYRPLSVVMEDAAMRDEMLLSAVHEYQAFRVKYQHLKALSRFFDVADAALPRAA